MTAIANGPDGILTSPARCRRRPGRDYSAIANTLIAGEVPPADERRL